LGRRKGMAGSNIYPKMILVFSRKKHGKKKI